MGVLREADFHPTMMEMETDRKHPGEDNTDLFDRIVRETDVDHYLVYLPRGAQLLGLSWEFRGLRDSLKARRLHPDQVQLFTEAGVAGLNTERGGFEFLEARNRTRYFPDLFHWGCTPRPWSDYSTLCAKFLQAAGEELALGD